MSAKDSVRRDCLVPASICFSRLAFGMVALLAGPLFAAPPNVIVFLSDDQGWGDLSLNGNTQLQTPNIDSLAHQGASFDRFFVCPVCSPTRAEFLTGRYHSRTGVTGVSTGQERLNLDEKTIADCFRAAGYATGAFGKWHNGSQWPYHPNARGFAEYYGFTSGHWGEYFDPPLEHNGVSIRGQGFIADDLTAHAIEFIEKNREKPFFCYVPYNTPHSPWAVPEVDWLRFKNKPLHQFASQPDKEQPDETRCALAMCENLDWNVGRVLKKVQELGLHENTIVLYFCDNGPNTFRWNGGMKGKKGTTDEGGVRSPLLIRWPNKIASGKIVQPISGAIDLLPTILSLTGVSRVGDKPLDGRDLSSYLVSEPREIPDRMIFSTWANQVSVRTQQFRLDHQGNLFDMLLDPGQRTDIRKDKPEVASHLSQAVQEWTKEIAIPKALGNRGRSVDPRPIHVGFQEFPRTVLPARDGTPHGGIQRSSSAPNCSYFVRWTSLDDYLSWDLEVVSTGVYSLAIDYTCPLADAGSTIQASLGDSRLTGLVSPGWDPPLYRHQDTLPRPPGESTMKEFRRLELGKWRIEKGQNQLRLKATAIPGQSVMHLRQIYLTWEQPEG